MSAGLSIFFFRLVSGGDIEAIRKDCLQHRFSRRNPGTPFGTGIRMKDAHDRHKPPIQVLPNDKNPADSRSVSRIFYTFSISRRLFSAVPEESRLRLFGCALHRDLLHIVVSLSAVPGGLDLCLCLDVQQFGHNIKRNGSHRVSTSSSFLQFQLTTAPGECYGRTARK